MISFKFFKIHDVIKTKIDLSRYTLLSDFGSIFLTFQITIAKYWPLFFFTLKWMFLLIVTHPFGNLTMILVQVCGWNF